MIGDIKRIHFYGKLFSARPSFGQESQRRPKIAIFQSTIVWKRLGLERWKWWRWIGFHRCPIRSCIYFRPTTFKMADQKRRLWKESFPETQIFFVGVLRHADDDSAFGFSNSHKKKCVTVSCWDPKNYRKVTKLAVSVDTGLPNKLISQFFDLLKITPLVPLQSLKWSFSEKRRNKE